MGTYKDSRKGAKRAERTYQICLHADLVADWEAADRELQRAREESRSANDKEGASVSDLADRVRALEAQMLERTETWRLRAMAPHKFRALVAAHPPRKGEDDLPIDEDRLGVDRSTFFPELIRACLVDPVLDDEDWAWLLGTDGDDDSGVLTDRQFGDLQDVAWFLNRGEVDVPFSHAASLASRDSAGE